MWDAVPGDHGPGLFFNHCEGEALPEGLLQPGQQLPGLLAVRKVGFKHASLKWFSWRRVTLLVRQKSEATVVKVSLAKRFVLSLKFCVLPQHINSKLRRRSKLATAAHFAFDDI